MRQTDNRRTPVFMQPRYLDSTLIDRQNHATRLHDSNHLLRKWERENGRGILGKRKRIGSIKIHRKSLAVGFTLTEHRRTTIADRKLSQPGTADFAWAKQ